MLVRLAELSARSTALREAVFAKEAGLGSMAAGAAKAIGSWAVKNPLTAAGAGLTTALTPMATKGSFQQAKSGFDPAVQRALLGPTPGG